ncbi:Docosahexaenoic acid omega-hydroxylase CYP4F3 [Hypsizygus marmoreus]|uniref:Docosahexaenoic acid omega-hydroxylase CYP4F3 n=1 Tax=Hypsizygus marmoreus TaxID=39966 RepID=A0A369JNG8_HYPMA|nr:Docosahexaenoic acid omega-hydroxylase CYP4F3 [Hypsizygus marmoreus]
MSSSFVPPLDAYLSTFYRKQLATVDLRWLVVAGLLYAFMQYLLAVPAELRHLPKVSPYLTIWSYARRESVDSRVRRLILPFAKRGEGVVLVYMLGKWGVHVLDANLVKTVCQDMERFPKKNYQDHLHFTFLSGPNVVFSNGEMWKRHSTSVKAAFDREIPVHRFVTLSHELFERMGSGGIHRFSDLVQRYTLDVVGTALLGHNFQALQASEDSFVDHFNRVMSRIATPTRLIFPFLDDWFPRHAVIEDVNSLNARYDGLLQMKRQDLGHDLLSYLLEDSAMSNEELRSNLAILFSAGHDTTSGALSTAMYHLAKHPEYQAKAREEVLSVIGGRPEPTLQDLSNLPFLSACIKEALRINSPISLLPARWTVEAVTLGKYYIPAGTSVVPNICAVHHNDANWPDAKKFDPYRFIDTRQRAAINIPFGTGPRQCVARQFSLFEQRTVLCMLLMSYEWSLPANSVHAREVKNEFGAFGLSIPHDLDLEFVQRK